MLAADRTHTSSGGSISLCFSGDKDLYLSPLALLSLLGGRQDESEAVKGPIVILDLSSSRVKDTLGHTLTPAFSVDSEMLRYFPGHANAFQILLLYGVSLILS